MASPTLRPENSSARPANNDAGEARSAARREVRGGAPSAAALKLLDRRPVTPPQDPAPRREREPSVPRPEAAPPQAAKAAVPERRVAFGIVSPWDLGAAAIRRLQLLVSGLAVAGAAAALAAELPVAVPVALLALPILGGALLTHLLAGRLIEVARIARAVNRGDARVRTATRGGELAATARALNGLLDERAANAAQASEQQQRLQYDIHHLASVAAAAVAGDVSQRARVQSGSLAKLAEELNAFLDSIGRLAEALRPASSSVVDHLSEAQRIAARTSEVSTRQGALIEATAGLGRAVAERNDAVAENAQVAAGAARRLAETAQDGGRASERLLEATADLRRDSQRSQVRLERLAEQAGEASGALGFLSRLAVQANLLALNAAIEAARAGERGLGFAAVADEVRRLAEDCESAARDVRERVSAVQADAADASLDFEHQAGRVERQAQLVSQLGEAFERIAAAAQQNSQLAAEISRLSQEEAGDAEKLEETILGSAQLARDLHSCAERSQRNLEAMQVAADELARRAAAFGEGAGDDTTAPR